MKEFWIIWSVRGEPHRQHETYELAEEEAKRLANKHPGIPFYILKAISYAVSGPVVVEPMASHILSQPENLTI